MAAGSKIFAAVFGKPIEKLKVTGSNLSVVLKAFEDYYDVIEVSHQASMAHPKSAIRICNKEMVNRADLVICFIEKTGSGAYKTIKYAKKQKKVIINLAKRRYNMKHKTLYTKRHTPYTDFAIDTKFGFVV